MLKRYGRKNHRSMEAELRLVPEQAVVEDREEVSDLVRTLARVPALFTGRQLSDGPELLRADWDRCAHF